MNFFLILALIGTAFLLINAILYLSTFKRQNAAYKIFCIYLCLISVVELATVFVAKILHQNNLFLSHFYFVFQFIILSFFYAELIKTKWIKYMIIPIGFLIVYQFIDDPELFYKYNPIGTSIMQSAIVIYSLIYLYRSLSGKSQFLIVNIGIFLYLLSSALIFVSGNLVLDLDISENTRFLLINVNRVLILVFQILIFVEWWKNYSRKKIS
jgi:hypothetical protein